MAFFAYKKHASWPTATTARVHAPLWLAGFLLLALLGSPPVRAADGGAPGKAQTAVELPSAEELKKKGQIVQALQKGGQVAAVVVQYKGGLYLLGKDGSVRPIQTEGGASGSSGSAASGAAIGGGGMKPPAEMDWSKLGEFKDIRRRMKSQDDWIEEFKKTHDYRIFYFLACRAGRVLDTDRAKAIAAALKSNPDKMEGVLKQWRIDMDGAAYAEAEEKAWKETYGDEAVIYKTSHYLILGTEKDKDFLDYLKYYQEKIYDYYEDRFKSREKQNGRFLVIIHPSREAYAKSGGMGWSGAYFSAAKRSLVGFVPRASEYFSGDIRRGADNTTRLTEGLIKTFFHEGWHQYMHYHVPNPPIWVDEGFAQLAECTRVNRSKLEDKGVTRDLVIRARKLVEDKRYMPLKEMAYMTIQQFQADPDRCYPQSYAFTHFLREGPRRYRKILPTLITELRACKDRTEALDIAFEGVDWERMTEDWTEHVLEEMEAVNYPSYFKK